MWIVGTNGTKNRKRFTTQSETYMKYLLLIIAAAFLSGCAVLGDKDYKTYTETVKSTSKDQVVLQAACLAFATEGVKSADPATRALAMATGTEKCKTEPVKVEPPKRGLFR